MVPPTKQSPPFRGSIAPTNCDEVPQPYIPNINYTINPDDQSLQASSPFDFLSGSFQADPYSYTGAAFDQWPWEYIQTDLSSNLCEYDCLDPSSIAQAPKASINAMLSGPRPNIINQTTNASVDTMFSGPRLGPIELTSDTPINVMSSDTRPNKRRFDCPVFIAEAKNGWPRTCNNFRCENMADLRRHLTERAGRNYTPQLQFLKLCPTCNNDFIDQMEFESGHGDKGERCTNKQPQRRGPKVQEQWDLLYQLVEAALAIKHEQTLQKGNDPALPGPSASIPAPSMQWAAVDFSAVEPRPHRQKKNRPYETPYELIFESDSDEERTGQEPPHNTLLVSNETSRSLSLPTLSNFDRRPLNSKGQHEICGNTESWPTDLLVHTQPWNPLTAVLATTSKRASDTAPPRAFGATSQVTPDNTFGESSEATSLQRLAASRSPMHTLPENLSPPRVEQDIDPYPHRYTRIGDTGPQAWTGFWHGTSAFGNRPSNRHPHSASPYTRPQYESMEILDSRDACRPPDPGGTSMTTSQARTWETASGSSSVLSEESQSSSQTLDGALECAYPDCGATFSGRWKKGNLSRHFKSYHKKADLLSCEDKDCPKTFKRSDARSKHYRKHHPELVISAELISRRTSSSRLSKPDDGESVPFNTEMDCTA